ncbi:GtrA family protein [Trujillonella humicola]|uniref:GtrA family protein n=1 Tax=Trujillonella humicola TaxID=3383699 RepID=UPI0039057FE9
MAATAPTTRPADGGPAPRPRLVGWLAGDLPSAQLVRFALVGGSANLVYAGLFLVLAGLGEQRANLVGVLVSTALANELHRRLSFRAGDRVGWATAQWTGGGLAVVGLGTSGVTLAALAAGPAPADPLVSVLAVCAVSGAVGLARFAGLRWVLVVRPGRRPPALVVPVVETSGV